MVHAIRSAAKLHPDAARIVGLASAITLNVALLLLLLAPMPMPLPQPQQVITQVVNIIDRIKPPVPPPVPVDAKVTAPQTPSHAAATPRKAEVPAVADQIVVEDGTLPADPVDTSTSQTQFPTETSGPVPGVRLEYLQAPAPGYPPEALRDGVQGTVLLQVLVDVDGRPLDVRIQQSSGNRQLDNAARRQVMERWKFRPAMKDGHAVQAIGLVPIAFNLDR